MGSGVQSGKRIAHGFQLLTDISAKLLILSQHYHVSRTQLIERWCRRAYEKYEQKYQVAPVQSELMSHNTGVDDGNQDRV